MAISPTTSSSNTTSTATTTTTTTSNTNSSTSSSSSSSTTSPSKSTSSTDYKTFDTATLVEAKLSSRYAQIDKLNAQATKSDTKSAAYQDLKDKLSSLNTSLDKLRADPSSAGQSTDVFRDRTSYLSSTSGNVSSYLSATVAEGTELGKHSIKVESIAKTNILGATVQSSRTSALGWSGSFSLGIAGGTAATVNVTSGMSLGDIADTINTHQSTTGVKASVMKVADNSYQLVLTTTQTGQTIVASDTSGSLLGNEMGLTDGSGIKASAVLQAGQNAKFSVDGVTITRSTNDISDVLDGVTLHLYSAPTTDTTLTLEVATDLSSVKTAINDFVTAYNTFRDFAIGNQYGSDGTAAADAPLYNDVMLRSIAQDVQTILSSSVDTQSLGAIGIKFDANNKLTIDESKLDNALQDNLSGVQKLFAYTMSASSGDVGMIRHPNSALNFTLDVTVDADGKLTGASADGDSSMFTVSGSSIVGKAGTKYAGLALVYTGATSKSISITTKQGLADQLFNKIDSLTASNGELDTRMSELEESRKLLDFRIFGLEESTAAYRNALTMLYGNMASKMSTAQTTVDLLKALLNAKSN